MRRDLGGWGESQYKTNENQTVGGGYAGSDSIAVTLLSVVLIGCGQDDRNPTENLTETSSPAPVFGEEIARREATADKVTILRDTWGIAHIYGVSDADTVFGTLYAQAVDTFIDWRQTTSTPRAGWLKQKEKHSFIGIFA